MLAVVLELIKEYGHWGLFIASAIEATAIPFPGLIFLVLFGFATDLSYAQLLLIGFINSCIYTLFSLIPYFIGFKMTNYVQQKLNPQYLEKARAWFHRYGNWAILLSRPTSLGNIISFVAGMSVLPLRKFLMFTFIGVFPWNMFLLYIGKTGNLISIKRFMEFLQQASWVALAVLIVYICYRFLYRRKSKTD